MCSHRQSSAVIGIDLGATCASVSIYHHEKVEIVADKSGRKVNSSCVAFSGSEILVGDGAEQQLAENITNTICKVKLLLGRKYSDEAIQGELARCPYRVEESDNGGVRIVVQYKGTDAFFTPEDLFAVVIKKLKEAAEAVVGKKVDCVVVAVPVHFDHCQRQSALEACALANLAEAHIVDEPVAAAFAYGFGKAGSEERTLLIFDIGASCLSVCILTLCAGKYEVKAAESGVRLGGSDFDSRLVSHFVADMRRKHKVDVSTDPASMYRLRRACKEARQVLSTSLKAPVHVDSLYQDISLDATISRQSVEELCSDLFRATIETVDRVVRHAAIDKWSIHDVILSGGCTKTQKIKQLLSDYFDGKVLLQYVDQSEVVAYGAGVIASNTSTLGQHN
mmetsp:Transcript_21562/g.55997  ORF Transcript_21562/g.55997 Transcript_21562/m.55997 type:complete len:393 (-) Transcript_21562:128-1306(-)